MGSCNKSVFFSAGLFITDVKSMTFLTRIKCFSLKSIFQIRYLGKNGVEKDKEGSKERKLMKVMHEESFVTNHTY